MHALDFKQCVGSPHSLFNKVQVAAGKPGAWGFAPGAQFPMGAIFGLQVKLVAPQVGGQVLPCAPLSPEVPLGPQLLMKLWIGTHTGVVSAHEKQGEGKSCQMS